MQDLEQALKVRGCMRGSRSLTSGLAAAAERLGFCVHCVAHALHTSPHMVAPLECLPLQGTPEGNSAKNRLPELIGTLRWAAHHTLLPLPPRLLALPAAFQRPPAALSHSIGEPLVS